MAAGDLTTLAALESYLTLTAGNSDEAVLSALISACSAAIATYCGRQLTAESYSERRDGTGGRVLFLRQHPITAVTSVTIYGRSIPAGDPVTPGYFFDTSRLLLTGYRFDRGIANVLVAYSAGFATIPADLQQACIELVALHFKERPHFDMSSKGNAGETTAFITAAFKPSTQMVLDRYRRVVPT